MAEFECGQIWKWSSLEVAEFGSGQFDTTALTEL